MRGPAQDPRKAIGVVALCGGVGGAKLALGLERALGPELAVIVNTGDDFEHLGLMISPDLDSVVYRLSGLNDEKRGWGRADESWAFMETLAQFGGETWFQLGDRDLALHVERTHQLRSGKSLTEFTQAMTKRLGVQAEVLPMSDDPILTEVRTPDGSLAFQRYFVERRCGPAVLGLTYAGAQQARMPEAVRSALDSTHLRAIVICPSNPYLSVDPILAVPGMREALAAASAPIVAVSPLIGGAAVKGPTTKIMGELGIPSTSQAIAEHYGDLIQGFVIDKVDAHERDMIPQSVYVTRTLMSTNEDCERLAREVLSFASRLGASVETKERVAG